MARIEGGGRRRTKPRTRKRATTPTKPRSKANTRYGTLSDQLSAISRRNSTPTRPAAPSSYSGGGGSYAAPTPATATPAAATPAVPAAPVIDREAIRQQVANALDPYYNQGRDAVRSHLVDQGIFSSTNAAKALRDKIELPFAQQRSAMQFELERRAIQDETQQQNTIAEMARRWYEVLASEALQKYGMGETTAIRSPYEPGFLDYFRNYNYNPPSFTSGPAGDPQEGEVWKKRTEDLGPSPRMREQERWTAENARADAYLGIAQTQAQAGAEGGEEMWADMAYTALQNLMSPEESRRSPEELLAAFQTMHSVDLVAEARGGNARAQNLIKLLYGDRADTIISGMKQARDTAQAAAGPTREPFFYGTGENRQYRPFGPTGTDIAREFGITTNRVNWASR